MADIKSKRKLGYRKPDITHSYERGENSLKEKKKKTLFPNSGWLAIKFSKVAAR